MIKNKKKALIMVLLLFTFFGVVGYGVYSYYYTEGTITTPSASDENSNNVIRITGSFNPYVDQSSGISTFLGNGGTVDLSCPSKVGVNETITCTAQLEVRNYGSTPIRVSYDNVYGNATSSDVDVATGSASLDWANSNNSYTILPAGSSEYLDIELDVYVGSSETVSSDTPQLVTEPVSAGSVNAYVSFRLDATQNTSGY